MWPREESGAVVMRLVMGAVVEDGKLAVVGELLLEDQLVEADVMGKVEVVASGIEDSAIVSADVTIVVIVGTGMVVIMKPGFAVSQLAIGRLEHMH